MISKSMGYKDFLSNSSTIVFPNSLSISKDTKWIFLNLGCKIIETILWVFFFIFLLGEYKKNPKPQQLPFSQQQHLHSSIIKGNCNFNFIFEFQTHEYETI